jgi:hypothetical protein
MKQQLHRSLTFWSGILVMIPVLWCWRDSRRFESSGAWGRLSLVQAGSGVVAYWSKATSKPDLSISREEALVFPLIRTSSQGERVLALRNEEGRTDLTFFPRPLVCDESKRFSVFIPHWAILLALGLPWLALLVIRARCRNRGIIAP